MKAKRRIRKCGGIASNERLYVQASFGPESFALSILLAEILSCRRDVSFVSTPANATAVVSVETLDSYACGFLRLICSGNVAEVLAFRGKVLDQLAAVPRNEVILYSRYHGWKGEDMAPFLSDPFSADVCAFLGRFSVCHPSAAYALMQIRDALPKLSIERINHAL
jgi:hypothetical protein